LLIDQFEQLWTLTGGDRRQFIAMPMEVVQSVRDARRIVLTMRCSSGSAALNLIDTAKMTATHSCGELCKVHQPSSSG